MRNLPGAARGLLVAALAFLLSACAGGNGVTTPSAPAQVPNAGQRASFLARLHPFASSGKIQHVVIIIQENRSVDNLFQGLPGANTQPYGFNSKGQQITLQPVPLEAPWDLEHGSAGFFAACDGQGSIPGTNCKMDGFDKEHVGCGGKGQPPCPNPNPEYSYVPASESKPLFAIANEFVFADAMFSSNLDGSSFVSHQFAIAGQASATVNFPTTTWGCGGGVSDKIHLINQQRQIPGTTISPCLDNQTLGDELDAAKLPWAYYATKVNLGNGGIWSAYRAIKHIRMGSDWKLRVHSPQTKFFKDLKNGTFAAVTWITPTAATSDHPGTGGNLGPHWVASLVNAIGKSPYWNSTAIFIFWDDPGGWYDHVGPAYEDYDGLGFRLPMLIVSPYAKQGYVSHVPYETGSILRFIEDQFGLARLAQSDARSNSPAPPEGDAFDFTQSPRPFVPIPSKYKPADFLRMPPDYRPPDND
jgi:phospholipase C